MNKLENYYFFLLILFISLSFRCYWGLQKDKMNPDEVFSLVLSNCNEKTWTIPFDGIYSGLEIKEQTLISDPSIYGCLEDLGSLYRSTKDDPHTNLYYSLLRISIIGVDSPDISVLNNRGIILNIVLYIIEFLIFAKLLLLLFGKKRTLLFYGTLLIFGVFVGGISNTILLREYQLQELAYVLLAFWVTKKLKEINNHIFACSRKNFFYTTAILSFVFLTGYFSIIYVGLIGLYIFYQLFLKHSELKTYLFFITSALSGLVLSNCLYLHFYMGFKGDGRVKQMIFAEGTFDRMIESFVSLYNEILSNTIYLYPGILLLLLLIIYIRNLKRIPWQFYISLVYCIVVFIIAPYKVNRYIVAATPLLLLAIPSLVQLLPIRKVRNITFLLFLGSYVHNACDINRISNLSIIPASKNYMKVNNCDVFWIVQSELGYPIVSIIPFMDNNQRYCVVNSLDRLHAAPGDIIAIDNVSSMYGELKQIPNSEYLGVMRCFSFYRQN